MLTRPGASSCLIKHLRPKGLINFSDSKNGADFKNPFLTSQGRGERGKKMTVFTVTLRQSHENSGDIMKLSFHPWSNIN